MGLSAYARRLTGAAGSAAASGLRPATAARPASAASGPVRRAGPRAAQPAPAASRQVSRRQARHLHAQQFLGHSVGLGAEHVLYLGAQPQRAFEVVAGVPVVGLGAQHIAIALLG